MEKVSETHSKEFLESSLERLRKRMTYVQDEMDCVSLAIRCIEHDLTTMVTEDKKANEKNA